MGPSQPGAFDQVKRCLTGGGSFMVAVAKGGNSPLAATG
jgi:hypothetical protein